MNNLEKITIFFHFLINNDNIQRFDTNIQETKVKKVSNQFSGGKIPPVDRWNSPQLIRVSFD
jgi:hypothetical protein